MFTRLKSRSPNTRRSITRKTRGGARKLGTPGVLKTRRMGYDGKGQFVVERPEDIDAAWISWARRG